MKKENRKKIIFSLLFILFFLFGLFNPLFPTLNNVQAVSCPFSQTPGRTIVTFEEKKIRSDREEIDAYLSQSVNLSAGRYKITAFSYDTSPEGRRVNYYQPHEQWKVILKNDNVVVAETRSTSDLQDFVAFAEKIDILEENLSLPSNINSVVAFHAYYPDNSSPNSVYPVCLAFDFISPPTVNLKVNGSDGPITIPYNTSATLSWTSTNANSCYASGDWSGSKPISGSTVIQMNQVKRYTFTLTCYDSTGTRSAQDSVVVNINPNPPTVITKLAVTTW